MSVVRIIVTPNPWITVMVMGMVRMIDKEDAMDTLTEVSHAEEVNKNSTAMTHEASG